MHKPSKTEDLLFEAMLNIGLKPERQYPISRMHVDFAFPREKLVIEVDGAYKRNYEGMKTLFARTRACKKEGWQVENFTAEEIFDNPQIIAWRIKESLIDLQSKLPKRIVPLKKREDSKNEKLTKQNALKQIISK